MISDVLCKGEDNAISAGELARMFQIPYRTVTVHIERERRAGIPICSCGKGYFLPATPEDIDTCCRRLRHRAGEIFTTRRALLEAKDRLNGD